MFHIVRLLLLAALLLPLSPLPAHAGLFDFIGDVFDRDEPEPELRGSEEWEEEIRLYDSREDAFRPRHSRRPTPTPAPEPRRQRHVPYDQYWRDQHQSDGIFSYDAERPMDAHCFREECPMFLYVNKSTQRMEVYLDGQLAHTWKVSTGQEGEDTPDFDRHPDGRIYEAYTSSQFTEGDYNGLGNMPYAMFIEGGVAIHGAIEASWWRLGTKASHGCIRLHPDNAKLINEIQKKNGPKKTWVLVRDY